MLEQLVINHLVTNEPFLRKVQPYMRAEYFKTEGEKVVFGLIDEFVTEYNAAPTVDALVVSLDKMKLAEGIFNQSIEVLEQIEPGIEQLDWLVKETEEWARDVAVHNAIKRSLRIYNGNDTEMGRGEIPNMLQDALDISFDTDLGHVYWEMAAEQYDYMHADETKFPFNTEIMNQVTRGGITNKTLNVVMMGINLGKAQPLHAMLKTPTGWTRMGDIKVGDNVMSRSGKPTEVTGVFPQGVKDVYEITLWDGRKTQCCGEHLWNIYKGSMNEKPKTVDTFEIIRLLGLKKYGPNGTNKIYIDLPDAVETYEADLPLDPYLLGALLGDGGLTDHTPMFSCDDQETVDLMRAKVEAEGCKLNYAGGCDYRISFGSGGRGDKYKNPIKEKLKALGVWGKYSYDKHIPKQYMAASIDQRLELVRGMLDADGHASKSAGCELYTTSKQLAEDFQYIIRSLGGISKIACSPSYLYGVRHRDSYIVGVRIKPEVEVFKLNRKLERHQKRKKRISGIAISSIDKVSSTECQCIMVDDEEHLYITDEFVVTHNTTWLIDRAAEWVEGGKNVLYVSCEVAEQVIRHRTDVRLMDKTFDQVEAMTKPEYIGHVDKLHEKTSGQLFIKEFASGAVHAGHIRAHVREIEAKMDIKIDMICVDYIGEMCSYRLPLHMMGNTNTYYGSIARELRALAIELDLPIWSAVQTTREAQESSDNGMDKVADAISIPKICDFMISFSQDEVMEQMDQARGYVMKNRYANKAKLRSIAIGLDNDRQKFYDVDIAASPNMSDEEKEYAKSVKVKNSNSNAETVDTWKF
ncbi:homing endonuclease [Vibrio phage 1.244.A._10N.261.54.C3]|nr:homing endonuclease [Vibrio phage 1.244.A._10N.261.54.C3]AUR98797.1 homing endonuclease [Vibrio phage 1.255.O._10N.286.45.F1]